MKSTPNLNYTTVDSQIRPGRPATERRGRRPAASEAARLILAGALFWEPLASCTAREPAQVSQSRGEDSAVHQLAPSEAQEPAADSPCDAAPVQSALGQVVTDALVEELKRRSNARVVRVLAQGEGATLDYRTDRLTIQLDGERRIADIRCV